MKQEWQSVIRPKRSLLSIDLKELWRYKDLMMMFVKRDFVAYYKQTIMGPLWFFIQPLLTTLTYYLVFNKIADISTDDVPAPLFYMAGTVIWNYFAACFNTTATTFKDNQNIFGKVYFPRLVVPFSVVISNLIKFGIQYALFIGFLIYFLIVDAKVEPNLYILLTPLYLLMMAGLALGMGLIISSLTTKYRDLIFLLQFGVQLLMYATPVIYPLSTISEKYKLLILANPMTGILEAFKYSYVGSGQFSWLYLSYSFGFMVIVMIAGMLIFNKTEQDFMDTV